MARFYTSSTAAPYSPATFKGTWDRTSGAATKLITEDRSLTSTATSVAFTPAARPYAECIYRGVSAALPAGLISGTANLGALMSETNNGNNCVMRIHAYITQGDSDLVRGTLITTTTDDLATNELQGTGGLKGMSFPSDITVTNVTAVAGDRLVIEFGYYHDATATIETSVSNFYGGAASSGFPDVTSSTGNSLAQTWFDIPSPGGGTKVTQVVSETVVQGNAQDRLSQLVVESAIQGASQATISQLVAEVIIHPFTTKEVTADAIIFGQQIREATATSILKDTKTKQVTADAWLDAGLLTNTKDITSDGIVLGTNTKNITATALVQGSNVKDVLSDAIVFDVPTKDISADGIVKELNKVLSVDASGVVSVQRILEVASDGSILATESCDVDADAYIHDIFVREYQVSSDAIIRDTKLLEVTATSLLQIQLDQEIEADAVVTAVEALDITADGNVQQTLAFDVQATGEILATQRFDIDSDAIVFGTNDQELDADGIIQVENNTLDADADSIIQQTNTLDVVADDYLIYIYELDVASDAIVHSSTELSVDADAYCPGIDGILRATIFATNRINAIPFVLGAGSGGYLNYVYPHPQDRKASQLQSKRIALLDLSIDGRLIEFIDYTDMINYTVYHEDGSIYIPTTDASWFPVYYDEIDQPVYGWTDIIMTPSQNETLKIVWKISVNNITDTIIDTIRVKQ